jgi:hypothetical protein
MKGERSAARVWLLVVACVSVPLCCLPICALVPSYPMFWGQFSVSNESGETVYVTPISERAGMRRTVLAQMSKFPYAPILKRADVRLEPGGSVQMSCKAFDEPMWRLVAIVVRNERGEYRQLAVDEGASSLLWASPEPVYRIGPFDELERVGAEAEEIARKAGRLNWRAWAMIAAGGVPVGLFGRWLWLVRLARVRSRACNEGQETDTDRG